MSKQKEAALRIEITEQLMEVKDQWEYETWFKIVCKHLREVLNYEGAPNNLYISYNAGETPIFAAEKFFIQSK